MVKIKIHAMYNHFPERVPKDGERFVDMYCDSYIPQCTKGSRTNVAMLLEPRSMLGDAYRYVEDHPDLFGAIFTHDSRILRLPHAHYLNWGDVWCTTDSKKTKDISIVSSWKDWCPLHHKRLETAKYFDAHPELGVDCFGSFREGDKDKWDDVKRAHEQYKFAIVIENDIDELWFTEKILNCFANKVAPIYIGATKIDAWFNGSGIMQIPEDADIPGVINNLRYCGLDYIYDMMRPGIEDNYKRVEPYKIPWKQRFFNNYESILEGLFNE